MKAWLSHEPGGPETLRLEEVPDPVPGPGEILIRVAAASLNFPDALIIEDKYQHRPPRPFTPGNDVAGTVVALGAGVIDLALGERVAALAPLGGLGELVVAEAWRAIRVPDAMPFDTASTLMMVYGTNIHGLVDRGGLKAGDNLLVLGAGGGIGTAAVELGKALGARVVAGVSSEEKAQAARQAGADEVIVYPRGPFDKAGSKALADRFKAACPEGYDVIYDPVGGDYAEPALRAIGWEGRYLVVGFTAGIPQLALNLTLLKACSVVGVYWGMWAARNRERHRAEMETVLRFWAEGKVRPIIGGRYPFVRAPDALAEMSGRKAIGKLVVTMEEDAA